MCLGRTCITCKYLEEVPYSDELFCGNENGEYADYRIEKPHSETCEEWEEREY